MKKALIILIFLFQNVSSQNIDGICESSDYFGTPLKEIVYYRYSRQVLKERYSSFEKVKNSTPEELIKSMFSAKNNKWVSFNYGQEMNWSLEQLKNLNDPNKSIELLCRIDLMIDNTNFSIVKLNLLDINKKTQFLSLVFKKINNRWIINSDNKHLANLNFLMMFTSVDDIDSIFYNTLTDNKKLNNLIKNSWNDKTLDLSMIVSGLGEMMINQEYSSEPILNSKHVKDNVEKNISVNYNIPFDNQKFCYYFNNQISKYDETELELVIDFVKKNNSEIIKITPIHKFSYSANENIIIIFKYLRENSEGKSLITEQFWIDNNKVNQSKPTNDFSNEKILDIIKVLNSDALIQVSNRKNNSDYSELNNLKPIVLDYNGVLNIEKLAKILNENKALLSKYLTK